MNFVNAADAAAFTSASPWRLRRLKLRVDVTDKKPRGGFKGASCFYIGENLKKIISREETGWWLTVDVHPFEASAGDVTNLAWPRSPIGCIRIYNLVFFWSVQCCCWWTTSQETVDASNVSAVILIWWIDWNQNWRRILSIKQYHGRSF